MRTRVKFTVANFKRPETMGKSGIAAALFFGLFSSRNGNNLLLFRNLLYLNRKGKPAVITYLLSAKILILTQFNEHEDLFIPNTDSYTTDCFNFL
jgi:hypothetical protein